MSLSPSWGKLVFKDTNGIATPFFDVDVGLFFVSVISSSAYLGFAVFSFFLYLMFLLPFGSSPHCITNS